MDVTSHVGPLFTLGSVSYLHVRLMTSRTPLYLLCWSCRRARTTWYGYVVTTANIFDSAAIVIYSSAFCPHRWSESEGERSEPDSRKTDESLLKLISYKLGSVLAGWKVTRLMPSMFPHCPRLVEVVTHQLRIWRHLLVFVVVSLELFVGHELQSSVRSAKQTRNVSL